MERIEVESDSDSSSSSDGSRQGEGLHANKAPVGPADGEHGDASIFAAFQELQPGHSADALVKIVKIRPSTYVESLSYFCGGGLRRGRVILFVSGRKKRVRFYTIAWSQHWQQTKSALTFCRMPRWKSRSSRVARALCLMLTSRHK